MLTPGTVLQKRYRIKRLLAKGGMGAVYEAEAVHLRNVQVAVKETFFNDFSNEKQEKLREQFEREAATLARLHHPALPQVKDHFVEGDGQFLVMDFIPGDDFDKLLERHLGEKGEPFGFWMVMEWAERLLDALVYIHGQYPPVIHRDIKPQNVKLTPRGELFLIDFGLAKDATTPTRPGVSVGYGTIAYAPIEQLKSAGTDVRSDLYSLGATLYHLVTGELPANAIVRDEAVNKHLMPDVLRPAHHVNPKIPFSLAAVIAKAMALDRTQRYQNAHDMRQSLWQAKQEIATEVAEKQREEEERKRREEEKRKKQEEARQRGIEEQRRCEDAARKRGVPNEINRKKEEVAKRKLILAHEAVTEPIVDKPVAKDRWIDQRRAVRDAARTPPSANYKAPLIAVRAIIFVALIALLAYWLWVPRNWAREKAIEYHLTDTNVAAAFALHFDNRSSDARKGLNDILKSNPGNAEAHFCLGRIDFDQKLHDDAITHINEAAKINPNFHNIWAHLAMVYLAVGQRSNAQDCVQRAIQSSSATDDPTDAKVAAAYALHLGNRSADARKDLNDILKSNPGNAEAHFCLGRIDFDQNLYDGAITHLDEAAKLNPNLHNVWLQLAQIYLVVGQRTKTTDCLQRAIKSKEP